jgi:uncharacterized membrane protein
MLTAVTHLFGVLCGQNPAHTWAPGGIPLPCCQRCLGLYAGAAVAALLLTVLKPKLTGRFLEVHGAFLLVMVPLGFHWLPHGSVTRTISGILFGFGVVAFLWLPLAASRAPQSPCIRTYVITLVATIVFVPLLASCGSRLAAYGLSGLGCCGAAALGGLVLANLSLAIAGFARFVQRPATHICENLRTPQA